MGVREPRASRPNLVGQGGSRSFPLNQEAANWNLFDFVSQQDSKVNNELLTPDHHIPRPSAYAVT
jgi:hypothetical protein